jgi:large-conductance mechanosensitive channel
MFNFDRQKVILTINKYISYLINILIVAALVGFIAFWIQTLIRSAQ